MTASSRIVRREILKVVDNQLRDGEPPATRETFDRLVAAGYSPAEARRLIGGAVAVEIWCILHNGRPTTRPATWPTCGVCPKTRSNNMRATAAPTRGR